MFEELQIEHGSARVDLALIGSELQAYELKSDADDFGRLHNQIHAYNRVFDRITIVTGPLHAQGALKIVPSWWGVMCVSRNAAGALVGETLREASLHDRQDPQSIAMLLWRDEALLALQAEAEQHKTSTRATRTQLQAELARTLGLSALRTAVAQFLLNRTFSIKVPTRSAPSGGLSHPDANYLDSRFQL
ncbi:hypothetical protein EZ313_17340 [Ramlibacter henchirensis]|uniref:Sce7726 family protein n=2 Tax=Ramlibacter henchirensis TaxID=204072 RepID=A0A4Z0BUI5_9BURK|nr:hypothetical protein EZ313_17340 [Ramlibacter henchirensis]